MNPGIDFYFDFSSPYAYFAVEEVEQVARETGAECRWRPMLLGPAFKASGNQPLVEQPLKGAYSRHDWERLARLAGRPYRLPDPFPVASLAAARLFWCVDAADAVRAKDFARAVFTAYFARGRNIGDRAVVADIAAASGLDRAAAEAAMDDATWKAKCKAETDAAIARGVFGSPFFFVGDEPFWGWDRLALMRRWLETGGW